MIGVGVRIGIGVKVGVGVEVLVGLILEVRVMNGFVMRSPPLSARHQNIQHHTLPDR